jgi:hypothetical protein
MPRFTSSARWRKWVWQWLMSDQVVGAVVAHLRDARAMAEGAQVLDAEPAVGAQFFGLLAGIFHAGNLLHLVMALRREVRV